MYIGKLVSYSGLSRLVCNCIRHVVHLKLSKKEAKQISDPVKQPFLALTRNQLIDIASRLALQLASDFFVKCVNYVIKISKGKSQCQLSSVSFFSLFFIYDEKCR